MTATSFLLLARTLLPPALMLAVMPRWGATAVQQMWGRFHALSLVALASTVLRLGLAIAGLPGAPGPALPGLVNTLTGAGWPCWCNCSAR